MTEVPGRRDIIAASPSATKAKEEELQGLRRRSVFERVEKSKVSGGANLLGTRFVLALKNEEDWEIKKKVLLVVQGHADRERNMSVHASITMRQWTVREI